MLLDCIIQFLLNEKTLDIVRFGFIIVLLEDFQFVGELGEEFIEPLKVIQVNVLELVFVTVQFVKIGLDLGGVVCDGV